jgi:hypothetical protein
MRRIAGLAFLCPLLLGQAPASPDALNNIIRMMRATEAARACKLRSDEWANSYQGTLLLMAVNQFPHDQGTGAGIATGVMAAARQEASEVTAARCASLPPLLAVLDDVVGPLTGRSAPSR